VDNSDVLCIFNLIILTGAQGMELPPHFFNFLFTYLFSIKFHLFIFYLMCSCPCPYTRMNTIKTDGWNHKLRKFVWQLYKMLLNIRETTYPRKASFALNLITIVQREITHLLNSLSYEECCLLYYVQYVNFDLGTEIEFVKINKKKTYLCNCVRPTTKIIRFRG
jgi:hypothetical protein